MTQQDLPAARLERDTVCLLLVDQDSRVVAASGTFQAHLGVPEAPLGVPLVHLVPEPDHPQLRLLLEGKIPTATLQFQVAGGPLCTGQVETLGLHGTDQLGLLVRFRPLSDLEPLVRRAFQDAIWGILVIRPVTTEILSVNPMMARMLESTPEALVGQAATGFIPPQSLAQLQPHAEQARLAGHHTFVTQFMRTSGTVFNAQVHLNQVKDPSGNLTAWMVFVHDVTAEEIAADRRDRLARVALALLHSRTPEQVMDLMLEEATQASGAYAALLMTVSQDQQTLNLAAQRGYPPQALEHFQTIPISPDLPMADAALTRTPIFVSAEELERFYPTVAPRRSQQTLSLAAIPLVIEDHLLAVLGLSFNQARPFDGPERDFLMQLTRQGAQALERVRLAQVEQRTREQLERQKNHQEFLSRASARLSGSLDLRTTVQGVLDLATSLADAAFLHRQTPDGPLLMLGQAQRPFWPELEPLLQNVLHHQQPLLLHPEDEPLLASLGIGGLIGVPLALHGHAAAVLTLTRTAPFPADHLEFAADFAARAALALENAELYQERLRAEKDARAREKDFKSLVDNLPGIVYRCKCDQDWTMVYMLGRMEDIAGYAPEEFIGTGARTYASIIDPRDVQRVDDEVNAAVDQKQPFDMQYRIVHRNGSVRWMHERGRATYTDTGEVLWLDGVILDVTERHQAEEDRLRLLEQIQGERARLIDVLEQMPVAVWLAEAPSGKLLFGNRQVHALWGHPFISAEDIGGYAEYRAFHTDGRPVEPEEWPLARTIRTGEVVTNEEIEVLRVDGSRVPAFFSAAPIYNSEGERVAGVVTGQDISALKRVERELRAARDELEARVQERTRELETLSALLQQQVQELEARNEETRLLSGMSEMLQACFTLQEAQQVVAQHSLRLFPDASGALYLLGASKNVLEELVHWGGPGDSLPVFNPEECWGLRRGRLFTRGRHEVGVRCQHLHHHADSILCVPLLAQGETVGLLHLSTPQEGFTATQQRLAQTVSETVALALVNIRLRDRLKEQSIRDPLTGLFNRRYLEETFDREARRAHRQGGSLALLMLDLDHFKQLNDTHGHEAGDVVLQEFGRLLQQGVRNDDVACRYGGEEFTLLLSGCSLPEALERAEQVREATSRMQVYAQGNLLGKVTCSIGVATFPEHGQHLNELMRAADHALYQAKKAGRNRVVGA